MLRSLVKVTLGAPANPSPHLAILARCLLLIVVSLIAFSGFAQAQIDPGVPDSIYIDSIFALSIDTVQFVEVGFVNDEELKALELTLTLSSNSVQPDSFSFLDSRVAYIETIGYTLDTTGTIITIYCFPTSEPLIPPGRGLLGRLYMSYDSSIPPQLVRIDTATVEIDLLSHSTLFSDTGFYPFVPAVQPGYMQIDYTCCVDVRGNVNNDIGEKVDISDLTYLVNAMFVTPGMLQYKCLPEANINASADGAIDISDLTYLVNYLFLDPEDHPMLPCGGL